MRSLLAWFALVVLVFGGSACSRQATREVQVQVSPLPMVSPPAWIVALSPKDHAPAGAQIRLRFSDDVLSLESLEAPERQALLSHLTIEPAVPGRFLVLTPRMIGFQADSPLPTATRFRVTLTKGFADLHGHSLDRDYAWTFETDALSISSDLPTDKERKDLTPSLLRPEITISSNAELDPVSLQAQARLIDVDDPKTIVALVPKTEPTASPTPAAQAPGEDRTPNFTTVLLPEHELSKGREYRLEIKPGVLPLHGNLPSGQSLTGLLATFGPLHLERVDAFGKPDKHGVAGRFIGGVPELVFNNGLVAASAAQAISLQPPSENTVPLVHIEDGDATVVLNPNALAPTTRYTITIASGLKDRFGQTLSEPAIVTFETTGLAGDLWAPTGFNIFPTANNLTLNVSAVNLIGGRYRSAYRILKPEDLIFTDPSDTERVSALLPAPWNLLDAPSNDREVTMHVPLREHLGSATGMLAYGVSAETNPILDDKGNLTNAESRFVGAVQLTNIGVFAQWFPGSGIVRTHRLSDGTPIVGAHITIYPSRVDDKERDHTAPCANGTTDANGTLELHGSAFARCAVVSTNPNRAPNLLVIARDAADWAFVRTTDYSGAYAYDIWTGWSAGVPQAHGAIVSDRDLYQPGEVAYFTGVAYFDTDGVLAKGSAPFYHLTLESPSGVKQNLSSVSPDTFGAFSLSVPLSKRQELGYYTLRAHADNGEELSGTFRVAQFKPPNFKVALTLDHAFATAGQSVEASWLSTYLFGAPVEGGNARIDVTRSRAYFNPIGWETFSFGRSWPYPEQEPVVPSDVLQRDSSIPSDGKSAQTIVVGDDLPYPMTYRVDAETRDVSNLSVAETQSFTALPSDALIGLQSDFVGTAQRAHEVSVIVTDPAGKPRTDRGVHVVLQKRSFTSATQIVEGSETPVDSVHYVDVASVDVTPGSQAQKISLTPPDAGDYRIRANFSDAKNDTTATDAELWVSGPGSFDWARTDSEALTVKLDKTKYRPGETARVLVQSPYPKAELLLAVVRHGVLFKKTLVVDGTAPETSFTVTPAMLPNAAVEAVLVRRGPSLGRGVPEGLGRLARIGFASFETALDSKYVKLTLTPKLDRIEPQQLQHVHIHATDALGRGVRTELALGVVNDAVLQLSGYRFPDLAQIVYADQPISTRLADNRADVSLTSPERTEEKGFGYGGGLEHGSAGTRIRTEFKPIAFYDGRVKTNDAGDADVSFTVPDNLTTWRVMAMSFSADARFGNGETTFIATKPLVTNAILPQFARPGDEIRGGVAVTNLQRLKGDVRLDGTLSGALAFVTGDTTSQTTSLNAPIDQFTQAYRFDIRVTGTDPSSVQFATMLGVQHDAFRETLDIRTNDVTESVVQVGATKDHATIPLSVDPQAPLDIGGLDLTLASTLLPQTQEAVRATLADETPFALSIASRVTVAADAIALNRRFAHTEGLVELQAALVKNLDALRALQRSDGGYGEWPGANSSEIFTSAFCAVSLARARATGASVGADIARVRAFLLSRLNDPSKEAGGKDEPVRTEIRLEALETLGILGDVRNDHLNDIYAQRGNISFFEQVELARFLLRLPSWAPRGMSLRDQLFERMHLTGRAAIVDVPDSSLETLTAGQAQIVSLLVDSRANAEDIDRAFRSLLDLRRNGVWPCPCDNAEAMDAVVAYAATQAKPPDFLATAELPGTVLHARFHGYGNASITQHIPAEKLPRSNATITLSKEGSGMLHYVVAYRYGMRGEQPGVYAGIRLERVLRSAADLHELARFGLALPAAPLTLDAARVFELEDRITTDHPIDNVVITDPLPAGFEAVDATFQTTTHALEPSSDNWEVDYQQISRDHVTAFAHHLDAGIYSVHYLVRSVTPGTYAWPPAEVHPQYAPEDFGRTATTRLVIQ